MINIRKLKSTENKEDISNGVSVYDSFEKIVKHLAATIEILYQPNKIELCIT